MAGTRGRRKDRDGRERLRRAFPVRTLVRLGYYVATAAVVLVLVNFVFGDEKPVLDNGAENPLAHVTGFLVGALVLGLVPYGYRLARPPRLEVSHYGLIVRPGALRTLVLPWVHIEQIAGYAVRERRHTRTYLLIACDGHQGRLGDAPGYVDRTVLREAMHITGGLVSDFDLAVRMTDFADPPAAQLARLSTYAPNHVDVVDLTAR